MKVRFISQHKNIDLWVLACTSGVRIGFGELDYAANEGDRMATILLTKLGATTENLTVPIMALSFDEFYNDMGRKLSDKFDDVAIPDPAECKTLHT